jgi:hypothetical protein
MTIPPASPTSRGRRSLVVVALSLAGLAAAIGVIVVSAPAIHGLMNIASYRSDHSDEATTSTDDPDADKSTDLKLVTFSTPCFSFDIPEEFIDNQSDVGDQACWAKRQGWGEMDASGTVTYTGFGSIWDQVLVEPILTEQSSTWASDGKVRTLVAYLETAYFPQLGEIISLEEPFTLDGVPANLTRFDSAAAHTQTKATLVVKAPSPYRTPNGDVQFFLITFVVVDERGDEIIDALVDSWRWN